jgi:GH24 family phage-related lysozyme (muramidase)
LLMRNTLCLTLCLAPAFAVLVGGCDRNGEGDFPTVDRMTAGIFLEDLERGALPPGMELRPIVDRGIELTKTSEGFRSNLYNDAAGYCTIAYGHLLKRANCNGTEPPHFLRGVTEPEGTELLVDDMGAAQVAVMTSVDAELTDSQYAALCDFVFNVGSKNFRRSTLLEVVNKRDFPSVPLQLRRWVYAGGRELPGLKTRRKNEIDLFFDGLPPREALPQRGMDLGPIDIRIGENH